MHRVIVVIVRSFAWVRSCRDFDPLQTIQKEGSTLSFFVLLEDHTDGWSGNNMSTKLGQRRLPTVEGDGELCCELECVRCRNRSVKLTWNCMITTYASVVRMGFVDR